MHPGCKEQAALLGFFVVCKGFVALFGKATCVFAGIVVVFCFAVREEAAVLSALVTPTHTGTTVEHADAATRNHDVELTLCHIAADIGCHDDQLLALYGSGIVVCRIVVSFTGKGELEALAARPAVCCRNCRECECHVATAINRERNLACASHRRTAAIANAAVVPVGAGGFTLVGALS